MRNCGTCRYWSEMIAMSEGGGPVKAMCLSSGKLKGKYMTERATCEAWAENTVGAVDTPGFDGTEYKEGMREAGDE